MLQVLSCVEYIYFPCNETETVREEKPVWGCENREEASEICQAILGQVSISVKTYVL